MLKKVEKRGISPDVIPTLSSAVIDIKQWLHGLIIDPETGQLDVIVNGHSPS